jgi:glycosyltransferase involved in cell wall biosynthesis
MSPTVSICVPNLNTRPFLPERFQTIRDQTFQDWELLVYDSYSNDGAWEYICEMAAREPRMRAWQGPRQGTPGSWNPCIREARGDYVYIATSDDTMPVDCLEKLVAALDGNPECDLAHCPLRVIDENGNELVETQRWWLEASAFAQSSGSLLHRFHVRRAPFDGLLHLLGGSVYTSITQLLIRRTLFDRIGLFDSQWGSVGDFHWSMRAGLAGNTVHVPDTWGGWRIHRNQATANVGLGSGEHARIIDEMIAHAVEASNALVPPVVRQRLTTEWLLEAKNRRTFLNEVAARSASPLRRRSFIITRALAASRPARDYVKSRVFGGCPADWVRRCLEESGEGPALVPANRSISVRKRFTARSLDPRELNSRA